MPEQGSMGFKKNNTLLKDTDSVLVYSTDPKDQAKISGQGSRQLFDDEQKNKFETKKFTAVFRMETNSRGGKTVTVIDQLPAYDSGLKELTKNLKTKCGSGGTYKIHDEIGSIEIQGDKRETIKKYFELQNIKYKGM